MAGDEPDELEMVAALEDGVAALVKVQGQDDSEQGVESEHNVNSVHEGFSLLDLPPELWVMIGKYILDGLSKHDMWPWAESWKALRQPAICRTSKALRAELLPYFYTHVEYRFWHMNYYMSMSDERLPLAWLQAIGVENRRHLRHVTMATYPSKTFEAEGVLRHLGCHFQLGPARACERSEKIVVHTMHFK